MEHNVNISENLDVTITFKLGKEEWQKAKDKEFRKLASTLKARGFRTGHVPEQMARRMISEGEVVEGAMLNSVNKEYGKILQDNNLNPFTEPQLSVTSLSEEGAEAKVTFALFPTVDLGQYKGLSIPHEEVSVSEEEVNEYIENLRSDHATMNVKDGEAQLGDTVIIDFKGYIDDSPFDGGEAKNYELALGSNTFIPGFEDKLVGIKVEEKRSIEVTFPDNYVKDLKGKLATFEVTCRDVKEKVLPELDEEFYDELDINDVYDLDSLKEYALKTLTDRKNRSARNKRQDDILHAIIENSKFHVGDAILTKEAEASVENIKKQVEGIGLSFDDYLSINNLTRDQLLEDKKQEALHNFEHVLVIEAICRAEKIYINEEMLNNKYEELASQYNMSVEDVKKALEPNRDNIARNLRNDLFIDFIEKNNE